MHQNERKQLGETDSKSPITPQLPERRVHQSFHQASQLEVLTKRWDEGYANVFILSLLVLFVTGIALRLPWLSGMAVSLMLTSVPVAVLAPILLNNNRATKVRVSSCGLDVESSAGDCHIDWKDIAKTEFREIGTYLLVRTDHRTLKLGAELSAFEDLVQQIEEHITIANLPDRYRLSAKAWTLVPGRTVTKRFYCNGRLTRDGIIWAWALLAAATLFPMSFFCAAVFQTVIALGARAMPLMSTHVSHIMEVFAKAASVTLLANTLLSPAHVSILRHVWYVDVDADGLILHRWVGKRRITWANIGEIAYDEKRHIVRSVCVNGRKVPIPNCIDAEILAGLISQYAEPAAAEQAQLSSDWEQ